MWKPAWPPIRHHHEQGMFVRERPAAYDEGAASAKPLAAVADALVPAEVGTILFIHGLGESGLCFEHLLERAELQRWHQLLPDLPGYGRSPWTQRPLSLAEQADHLAGWLRKRSDKASHDAGQTPGRSPPRRNAICDPVVVIGHSMGGVVGLLLGERHPDLVSALVNVDGNLCRDDCVFSGRAAKHSREAFLAGGFERLRADVFQAGRWDAAQRGYYVSLRLCDPSLYHANSRELVAISEKEDLAERLRHLPLPATYIAGVPDGASARSRILLDEAGVDWVGIEPSGHWPFIDQADDFMRALRPILAALQHRVD